jgi:hypothetical protein
MQNKKMLILAAFATAALCCFSGAAIAETMAFWSYDLGTAGTPFSDLPVVDETGNGNTMLGYDSYWGASYSVTTVTGSGLGARHDGNHQDSYVTGSPLNSWSSTAWTIEIACKLDSLANWNTIIGRDGTAFTSHPKSDFYFQENGIDNRFRVDFTSVDGANYVLDSDFIAEADHWYGFAIVSDGLNLTMYCDKLDGNGYQSAGTLPLSATPANNAMSAAGGSNWTFGRGWYNGNHADRIAGNLDNIRFSDTALTPDQFLGVPEPNTILLLALAAFGWLCARIYKK